MRWNEIRKYNVIVLAGLGESNADGSLTKFNRETVAVLRRFTSAGGGLMVLGHFGQRQTEISPQEALLKPLGLQPVWLETTLNRKSVVATPWKIDFGYTTAIRPSPLTKNVKALWYPAPKKLIGAQHHSLAFTTDKNWKEAISAGPDSYTSVQVKGAHTTVLGNATKSAYESNMPLAVYRNVDSGRIVYFGISHEYIQGPYAHSVLEGIVMTNGIGYRKSDGLKFFENSLHWLAAPSMENGKLGGAKTNDKLLLDPEKVIPRKPYNWSRKHKHPQNKFDMPGLIGARSSYSGGKGTPEEWASAAKKAGYSFLVFLEDYKKISAADFDKLKKQCEKLSDDKFAAFPGITIDDEIGNHYFYFGNTMPLPGPKLIDDKNKVLRSYDPALGGHVKGQLNMTILRYFTGKCIARLTGGNYLFSKDAVPFSDWFGSWNAIGVVTSVNGKLEEFAFRDYLKISNSGQGPTPLALTLVDDPAKISEIKWRTVYKSKDGKISGLQKFFNRHKFYPDNPCTSYITTGPRIDNWSYIGPRDYEGYSKGDYLWNNYRWIVNGAVSSDVPLKEVRVWDGVKLFRRFQPQGKKKFSFNLDLTHNQQHYLVLEAEDTNGGIAVSRDHWDRNHRLEEFMCGDRNNQLTYSMMVDSKGKRVMAGNNHTLGTPNKRVWPLAVEGQPQEIFRSVAGFDGGVSRGPKFYSRFKFNTTGKCPPLPNVAESHRLLHTMDVAVGDAKFQHNFTDNIRVANVWHTTWKTAENEYFDVYFRRQYFQLDPDQPIGAFIKTHRIVLKKDLPNKGITLNNFTRPNGAKQFAVHGSNGSFWCGAVAEAETKKTVNFDFGRGAYLSMFDSATGGGAVYPLSSGLKGRMLLGRTVCTLTLPADKTPQKAGDSVEFKLLYVGTPAREPHPITNNWFFETFYRQFGLDGGKCGYKVDLKAGKIAQQRYVLTVDGKEDKCFSAKLTGKLVARLPIAVTGMNDKWSAILYDGSNDRIRPLGMLENTVWATVVVSGQELFVGHPVYALNEDLFIQVTRAGDKVWNIEIHNPTDKDIETEVYLNKFFPPFKGQKNFGVLNIKAGTSVYKTIK